MLKICWMWMSSISNGDKWTLKNLTLEILETMQQTIYRIKVRQEIYWDLCSKVIMTGGDWKKVITPEMRLNGVRAEEIRQNIFSSMGGISPFFPFRIIRQWNLSSQRWIYVDDWIDDIFNTKTVTRKIMTVIKDVIVAGVVKKISRIKLITA